MDVHIEPKNDMETYCNAVDVNVVGSSETVSLPYGQRRTQIEQSLDTTYNKTSVGENKYAKTDENITKSFGIKCIEKDTKEVTQSKGKFRV